MKIIDKKFGKLKSYRIFVKEITTKLFRLKNKNMTTLQTIESNVNLAIRNLITTPELDALLSSELENIWLPEVYTTKDVYNANVKAMKKLFYAGRIGTIKNK